jgi:hypothetical protein
MERVLDVYALPKDDDIPLIVMDEASKELHGQLRLPLPMTPGTPLREDDKYQRNGTSSIFMFFAPLLGWRRATCGEQRTRQDWAREVQQLLTVDFPTAAKVLRQPQHPRRRLAVRDLPRHRGSCSGRAAGDHSHPSQRQLAQRRRNRTEHSFAAMPEPQNPRRTEPAA